MIKTAHRFALELRTLDARLLRQEILATQLFEPAREWALFSLLRRTKPWGENADLAETIEPLPSRAPNTPYADGFRVVITDRGRLLGSTDFKTTYLTRHAQQMGRALVTEGKLTAGDRFHFFLQAYPTDSGPTPDARPDFSVSTVEQAPTLKPVSLATLSAGSSRRNSPVPDAFPFYVPQQTLDEAEQLTIAAGAAETGGILIGHVVHDSTVPESAVRITAQIPARHTERKLHELTFTPETWSAVRDAIQLRGKEEVMVGWWHTHPSRYWCKTSCPEERRRSCPLLRDFFSEDDRCLHETVFPKAFQVALVVNHTDDGIRHAAFGWHEGVIVERDFWCLNGRPDSATLHTPNPEGTRHATSNQ